MHRSHYLLITYASAFWIFLAYAYLLILLGLITCLYTSGISSHVYRRQAQLLLLGGLIPMIISFFDVTYVILPEWNLTPMSFLFTGISFLWGMYRIRLWDLTPVAYQIMFQKMIDGVFVIDWQYRIVEMIRPPAKYLVVPVRP